VPQTQFAKMLNLGIYILASHYTHLYNRFVKKKRPRRKSDQNYWDSFQLYLVAALKARNAAFKVPAEVWIGLPVWAFIGAVTFRLGASTAAWNKNWWKVVLLVLIGELVLFILRPSCRFVAALWEVCHEERFRGISRDLLKISVLQMMLLMSWTAYYWHYNYVRSPHFELSIQGLTTVSNVMDPKGVPANVPVSSVFFEELILTNKYYPARTSNWRLVGTLPDGRTITGYPGCCDAIFATRRYSAKSCIYNSRGFDAVGGVGNRNVLGGCGEFIFEGIRESTLLDKDLSLSIAFDANGETFENRFDLPLQESPNPFGEVSSQ
jgi:hypothetical protein